MSERRYSKRCDICRHKTMALAVVPYRACVDHDGRKYIVFLPSLCVPQCSNCGALSIDDEADNQIMAAFRQQAGLLLPEQIREGREKLGLSQQELADWFGIAVSTLSRWETGAQVQQRIMNDHLRAFFEVPQFREYLRQLHRPPSYSPTARVATAATV